MPQTPTPKNHPASRRFANNLDFARAEDGTGSNHIRPLPVRYGLRRAFGHWSLNAPSPWSLLWPAALCSAIACAAEGNGRTIHRAQLMKALGVAL